MFQTNIWVYPWDLVDEGIDEALDRLKGEAGVTGIAVATNYHSIDQFRPHPGVVPRTFRAPAGAQFQPQVDLYAGTRMRPQVAAWLKKSNPLKEIGDKCEKRGLAMRAWTVCCHGSTMVSRYPWAAVKDVFGDPKPNWVCPINPDVREYLRAMVEDLTRNYPFETVELERPSFDAAPHSHAHQKTGFPLGEIGRWLYNVCFCESCRQGAQRDGIEVGAAARLVSEALETLCAGGSLEADSLEAFVADRPALKEYVNWRCEQVTSLVRMLKQACLNRVVVHRVGDRYLAATDFKQIAAVCDGLLQHCPYPDRGGVLEAVVREVWDETQEIAAVELGFNATTPPCPGEQVLVSAISGAAKLGVRSIDIYNYGLLPLDRLDWIRKAARYAQREAD